MQAVGSRLTIMKQSLLSLSRYRIRFISCVWSQVPSPTGNQHSQNGSASSSNNPFESQACCWGLLFGPLNLNQRKASRSTRSLRRQKPSLNKFTVCISLQGYTKCSECETFKAITAEINWCNPYLDSRVTSIMFGWTVADHKSKTSRSLPGNPSLNLAAPAGWTAWHIPWNLQQ